MNTTSDVSVTLCIDSRKTAGKELTQTNGQCSRLHNGTGEMSSSSIRAMRKNTNKVFHDNYLSLHAKERANAILLPTNYSHIHGCYFSFERNLPLKLWQGKSARSTLPRQLLQGKSRIFVSIRISCCAEKGLWPVLKEEAKQIANDVWHTWVCLRTRKGKGCLVISRTG